MLEIETFANAKQITIEKENNLFIIEENGGLILIDTAVESEQINDVIALIKEDGRPLKAIAITHSHDDHLGGLIAFKQAFPDTPFLFPEREYQLILKKELLPSDKQVPLKEGIPNQLPFVPDKLLVAGDKVGELEVIFTPGHTPGHICFHNPAKHYLLVGDVLQTLGGAAICGVHRDAFPKPARLNWDLALSIDMVKGFIDLDLDYIGTGHGEVMTRPNDVLPLTITEAEALISVAHNAS
ncbi:MBL fold metallo-hydrolase [Jeotgalibaca porci]|uniref:MBL fold metallo-hydrolase n=1 Tax=Jeotgalibaca porci TaxID=1868793 RepID=UPI003F922B44